MTVRNGTATLPPPATAAARAERPRGAYRLRHICAVHLAGDGGCPGGACRAYCGHRWRPGARVTGTTDDPITPDDCQVCLDLWEMSE